MKGKGYILVKKYTVNENIALRDIGKICFRIDIKEKEYYRKRKIETVNYIGSILFAYLATGEAKSCRDLLNYEKEIFTDYADYEKEIMTDTEAFLVDMLSKNLIVEVDV